MKGIVLSCFFLLGAMPLVITFVKGTSTTCSVSVKTTDEQNMFGSEEQEIQVASSVASSSLNTSTSNLRGLWSQGQVPFEITDEFSVDEEKAIYTAMMSIVGNSCIRFVKRSTDIDYIHIRKPSPQESLKSCFSKYGNTGGKHDLILSSFCLSPSGWLVSFLLASLGIKEDYRRSDRDNFVKIYDKNIRPANKEHFEKLSPAESMLNLPYDFESVTHVSRTDFAVDKGKPCIEPFVNKHIPLGQRQHMTRWDIMKINYLYCPNTIGVRICLWGTKLCLAVKNETDESFSVMLNEKRTKSNQQIWTVDLDDMMNTLGSYVLPRFQLVQQNSLLPVVLEGGNHEETPVLSKQKKMKERQQWNAKPLKMGNGHGLKELHQTKYQIINKKSGYCIYANSDTRVVMTAECTCAECDKNSDQTWVLEVADFLH